VRRWFRNRSGSPVQVHPPPPCACSATIAESEVRARFRKGPGLYFLFLPGCRGERLVRPVPIFHGPLYASSPRRKVYKRGLHERWGWLIIRAFKGNHSPSSSAYDNDPRSGYPREAETAT
jgi:hypothetical protein